MSGDEIPTCPYGDKACPKVEGIEKDLRDTKKSLEDMKKVLYIIAGILTVQLGITII